MESPTKKAEIQYTAIDILERSIALPESMKEAPAGFNFNINVTVQVNEKDSMVTPCVSVTISEKEGSIELGKIVVNNIIKVGNLQDFLVSHEGGNAINDALIRKLTDSAISTTRGVMWDSFRGTFLHGAILPIIDSSQGEVSNK